MRKILIKIEENKAVRMYYKNQIQIFEYNSALSWKRLIYWIDTNSVEV